MSTLETVVAPSAPSAPSSASESVSTENRFDPGQGDRALAARKSSLLVSRRIVHVIKHCGFANGSVNVAVDLACLQASHGCEVSFVSAGGAFVPLLTQYGVRHVTMPHEQNRPFSVLKAAWQLSQLVRETRAEIVHAHMMSSAMIGFAAAKLNGARLVTTVHNSFDPHSVIMRLGDRVVAVSGAEKIKLVESGYDPDQVDTVQNAPGRSPREGFAPDGKTPEIQSPCILTVCGLHRRKGVFDLIEGCAPLLRELPEWRLYIAGEGPDLEQLQGQAAALGLSDRIVFLGFVRDPRALLEKADIFVLASYADPCSLVIGEARFAGCAIVATRVGGTPEMLDFGEAGRLFSPGNVEQLRSSLRPLMVDEETRTKLRQRSLQGSEIFDAERLVVEYDQVYRRA